MPLPVVFGKFASAHNTHSTRRIIILLFYRSVPGNQHKAATVTAATTTSTGRTVTADPVEHTFSNTRLTNDQRRSVRPFVQSSIHTMMYPRGNFHVHIAISLWRDTDTQLGISHTWDDNLRPTKMILMTMMSSRHWGASVDSNDDGVWNGFLNIEQRTRSDDWLPCFFLSTKYRDSVESGVIIIMLFMWCALESASSPRV